MSAFDTLTRRADTTPARRRWTVTGPAGAVCLTLLPGGAPEKISIHWRTPLFPATTPGDPCDVLAEDGCYFDAGYLTAQELWQRWVDAGRDDEVIWAELEEWYADRAARTSAPVEPSPAVDTLRAAAAIIRARANAEHIAAWSPVEAAQVADLLDAIAQDAADNDEFDGSDHAVVFPPSAIALGLAELIVGGAK